MAAAAKAVDDLLVEIEQFLTEANRRDVTYEPVDVANRLLDLWNQVEFLKELLGAS